MPDPFRRSAIASATGSAAPASTTVPSGTNTGLMRSPVDFTAVRSDVSDITAGRVTLAMLDLILLGLIGFYLWTKTAQGGS
jgi:hypothetical protein